MQYNSIMHEFTIQRFYQDYSVVVFLEICYRYVLSNVSVANKTTFFGFGKFSELIYHILKIIISFHNHTQYN